jgi:hypothetical protein
MRRQCDLPNWVLELRQEFLEIGTGRFLSDPNFFQNPIRAEIFSQPSNRYRECCLLILDSVTSTPQWIRQQKPRDVVYDMCVFVCKCVLGSPRASQPLNIRLFLF